MTPTQAEGLRSSLNALVAACDRVNLRITKANTRTLTSEEEKLLFWIRRFVVGTREQGANHLRKVDKLIDQLSENNNNSNTKKHE